MPEISMCSKTLCPSRLKCFRFTATPNERRQPYTEYVLLPESDKCDSFLEDLRQSESVDERKEISATNI